MTLRTVELPIELGGTWDNLEWNSKAPGDNLDYTLNCDKWLTDAGRTLLSAEVAVAAGTLSILGLSYGGTGAARRSVIVRLAGGVSGTASVVTCTLYLSGGRRLTVEVALPIGADTPAGLAPFVPPNALTVGGQALTIGGALLVP